MAKGSNKSAPKFKLTSSADRLLNHYLAEIRKGVLNVCEIHMHDSAPSMSKGEFEKAYIEKVLGQTATAVSASIKAIVQGIAEQKERQANAIRQDGTPAENKEDK